MSILKRLFGLESSGPATTQPSVVKEVEHSGYVIRATPFKEGDQFQTCGVISKEIEGQMKEHKFIRADRFSSLDDAADVAIRKGRQMIDEQDDRLFD